MVFLVVVLAWLVFAVAASLLVGGGIRTADQRMPAADALIGLPADFTVEDIVGAGSLSSRNFTQPLV